MGQKKSSPPNNPYSYLCGWIQDKEIVRVAAQIDEITRSGSDETELMKCDLSTRKWQAFNVEFRVVSIGMSGGKTPHLFGAGLGGDVVVASSQGTWEENVDDTDDGPRRRGDIRTVQIVGNEVLAAGMGRQVYRRVGKNKWERADEGLVQIRGELLVSGINAIDGTANGDLVAVGFLGEIWERLNGKWVATDSPTNLILHDVKIVGSKTRFCSGQEGLILVHRGNGWERIDQDATTSDIWAIEHFEGQTYFAAEDGLFVSSSGKSLARVDLGKYSAEPFRHVHANAGLMLAVSTKAVLLNRGGATWEIVSP